MSPPNMGSAKHFVVLALLTLTQGCAIGEEKNTLGAAQRHAEKGVQASKNFPGYADLCRLDMRFRNVNVLKTDPVVQRTRSPSSDSSRERSRVDRTAPPMQVFDNLYFVGNQAVSSWLLGTEDGYILIDAMNSDEEAESVIEAGILALGLDPTAIKYLLITHAHGDHFGGYAYIKETYDPQIVMSETDWQLASQLREHPRFGFPPAKDVAVIDGDQLIAGGTTLDIHVTAGHTPGTISPVFTVYDNGTPYRAILWGGTGFNFGPNQQQMNAYATSASRLKEVAIQENIQVFFSNHGRRDGSLEKMKVLAERQPGQPHPFVQNKELLSVFEVLEQCALAQAARISSGDF